MDGVSGFVFDPSRLRQSPKRLERDGYALAGRLLRDQLGGDPLADIRRRARRARPFGRRCSEGYEITRLSHGLDAA